MKKIIYISWSPLTNKLEKDWFISFLISKGVEVEFWDVSELIFKKVIFPEYAERNYCRRIDCYRELKSLLSCQDVSMVNFVLLANHEIRTNRLYRILSAFNCRLCMIEWGSAPMPEGANIPIINKIIANPRKYALRIFEKLVISVSKRLNLVKPYDVVLGAGDVSLNIYHDALKTVPINHCDYENYRSTLGAEQLVDEPYGVFLDINLTYQPDVKITGRKYIDAQTYYDAMNKFFDHLEKKYDLKIVIAAHPGASVEMHCFGGRKILKGVTPILVRDSKFVITHWSLSLNYAVLNQKPVVFVCTSEIKHKYANSSLMELNGLANYFETKPYCVDEMIFDDELVFANINKEISDKYKYQFLTSRICENKNTAEIFFEELAF